VKTLVLNRIAQSEAGTFGVLIEGQFPFALTLEPPWRNNEKVVSCIPQGEYVCKGVNSPQFGDTFEVMDVEERTHILFHKGNVGKNTKGCILVGEQYEKLNGKPAILASAKGYKEFMDGLHGHETFGLVIVETWGLNEVSGMTFGGRAVTKRRAARKPITSARRNM